MKRYFSLVLALSLLLSGCGFSGTPYISVTPHREQRPSTQTDVIAASNYQELLDALKSIISAGTEVSAVIVENYPDGTVEQGMDQAVHHILEKDPIGAYAVDQVVYELGTSSGMNALSVSVTYLHSRSEIQRIRHAADMEAAMVQAAGALEGYNPSLVMLVEQFEDRDVTQYLQDYAQLHPQTVMEMPQVTENIYGTGESRVVELLFAYQTSREALRRMQQQVQPVFDAASLYVSGDGEDRQKFSQLYAFLMERFDYKVETSITPAYSLLRHGVGDSRAFATVYAAMCRGAGLECLTVNGTRSGEPWTWNMVLDNGNYYHVDLLRCSEQGHYQEFVDAAMVGYVWDYSAYPACEFEEPPQETRNDPPAETEETTVPTEIPTVPSEEATEPPTGIPETEVTEPATEATEENIENNEN